ncbi:hypothetical protein EJ06DRAFT_531863 [Trichodelitschia bisporula]|uniref:Uncharacterized protein n=1 Tax=Trichodelitschia bisporula TaxID=703511 RepID=A0A6G1HSG9_9PEZI|nr:hypothetical protein EJ06DRAFT_531863 [Trichodelitschia bisporula]
MGFFWWLVEYRTVCRAYAWKLASVCGLLAIRVARLVMLVVPHVDPGSRSPSDGVRFWRLDAEMQSVGLVGECEDGGVFLFATRARLGYPYALTLFRRFGIGE